MAIVGAFNASLIYSNLAEIHGSLNIIHLGGTQRASAVPGSTVTFRFNGTAVWYFADRSVNNTIVSISLDGAPAETVDTSYPTTV